MADKLKEYRLKRDFRKTLEPAGATPIRPRNGLYVMHKHAASHDHFDLRLEQDGVLRSWALPKGASLEPGEKRLAVEVEDHPLEYGGFEGVIPENQYGGGTVMLWDTGSWRAHGRQTENKLDFELHGDKLKGRWSLVRMRGERGRRRTSGKHWLLIKRTDSPRHALDPHDMSVLSGRSMEQIARQAGQRAAPPEPGRLEGARRKPMLARIVPQLATLADNAPAGEDWLHEIKLDGYRIMARLDKGEVILMTRNGKDWSNRFPELVNCLKQLPVERAFIDGEIIALSGDGAGSFQRLQEILSRSGGARGAAHLVYKVFDLLHLEQYDLRGAALATRKKALAELLDAAGFGSGLVRYSDHVRGQGPDFIEEACGLGLEGIVCKRADAPYRAGRTRHWLKVKCTTQDEFVVGGFTDPGGTRTGFGSLLLGAYRGDQLIYAGRVGSGFGTQQLERLHQLLRAIEIESSPFHAPVPDTGAVHWVKPELVVDVAFTERTGSGYLRHPVFRGLREDRDPGDIRSDGGSDGPPRRGTDSHDVVAGIRLSHPERVMYAEQGVTKIDLAQYYQDIHEWILPYLAYRPLSLLRCPEGWETKCFFQKHAGQTLARGLPRTEIREKSGQMTEYVHVRSASDIVALVQAGVLELHPWGCLVNDIEHPDIMIFDLDPAPDVPWKEVLRSARELRERLNELGLTGFPRTTGGKGLHVVVPIEPRSSWEEMHRLAHAIARAQAGDDPGRHTTNMSKARRGGRIYIDYLRNRRGNTAVSSYSTRARHGAPVATPLRWDELSAAVRSDHYRLVNVRRRLGALKRDPWEGFFECRAALTTAMARKAGLGRAP